MGNLALQLQSVVQNLAQQMAIVLLDSGFVVLFRELPFIKLVSIQNSDYQPELEFS